MTEDEKKSTELISLDQPMIETYKTSAQGVGKRFTKAGIQAVEQLTAFDVPLKHIAALLGVSEDWFLKAVKTGDAKQAVELGKAKSFLEFRKGRKDLAKVNASASIWEGKNYYGEKDALKEVKVDQRINVVGTLPISNDDTDLEQWLEESKKQQGIIDYENAEDVEIVGEEEK